MLRREGEILYNGIPSNRVDLDLLREKIGFVTQDTQLFSGSIRENLLFVNPEATDAECMEVLEKAAADSLLSRADRGLDTLIGEGGVKVSGGEKQRLSIARALLRRPQLLVFDEATSSLDSLTEEEISRTIREVATNQRGDHDSDCAPAFDGDACGPNLCAGARTHCRVWAALGVTGTKRSVLRDVAAAGGRTRSGKRRLSVQVRCFAGACLRRD